MRVIDPIQGGLRRPTFCRCGGLAPALAAGIGVLVVVAVAVGEPAKLRPLDEPVMVTLALRDGGDVVGRIVAASDEAFELRGEDGTTQTHAWHDLSARGIFVTYQQVMDRTQGEDWLTLAGILAGTPDGHERAESALQVAEALDPALAERVAAVRAAIEARPEAADGAGPATDVEEDAEPEQYGWGDTLTPEAQAAHVAAAKAYAARVSEALGFELHEAETEYFLFYTNLSPKEAYEWQRILDLMYARVSYLLQIPEGVNIFKGKALVFFFETKEQFAEFEKKFHDYDVTFQAGLCHQMPTGEVEITFYLLDDRKYLKQLMIHEATHGMIHRYRSPHRVPAWLNEGIAEWTAWSVVDHKRPYRLKRAQSAAKVKETGRMHPGFFDDPWRGSDGYGTALAMVEMLLKDGRPRFIAFIDRIKEGQHWAEALYEEYELTPDELVYRYGRSIGIDNLKR